MPGLLMFLLFFPLLCLIGWGCFSFASKKSWWLSVAFCLVIMGTFFWYLFANKLPFVSVFMCTVVGGFICGICYKYHKSWQVFLLISSILITVFGLVYSYGAKSYYGADLFELSRQQVSTLLEQNSTDEAMVTSVNEMLEAAVPVLAARQKYLAAYLFVDVVFAILILSYMLKFVSETLKKQSWFMPSIEKFKLNDYLVFIFFILWAGLLILYKNREQFPLLWSILVDATVIMAVLYCVQAFAIIKDYTLKHSTAGFIILLLLLSVVLLPNQIMIYVGIALSIFGCLDFWIDYRKLRDIKPKEKSLR